MNIAAAHSQDKETDSIVPKSNAQVDDVKKGSSSTDDDLFKKLTGDSAKKNENPSASLDQAIREMREVQQRIDRKETGQKTRALQQNVITNLEKLIQQIQRQAQASSSGGGSPKPANGKPGEGDPKPTEGKPAGDGKTREGKAPDSTDDPRNAENRKNGRMTSGRMASDIWGHLPPALREKLRTDYQDKYLPKYDDVVRRYFESLAEEGRSEPRRK